MVPHANPPSPLVSSHSRHRPACKSVQMLLSKLIIHATLTAGEYFIVTTRRIGSGLPKATGTSGLIDIVKMIDLIAFVRGFDYSSTEKLTDGGWQKRLSSSYRPLNPLSPRFYRTILWQVLWTIILLFHSQENALVDSRAITNESWPPQSDAPLCFWRCEFHVFVWLRPKLQYPPEARQGTMEHRLRVGSSESGIAQS